MLLKELSFLKSVVILKIDKKDYKRLVPILLSNSSLGFPFRYLWPLFVTVIFKSPFQNILSKIRPDYFMILKPCAPWE